MGAVLESRPFTTLWNERRAAARGCLFDYGWDRKDWVGAGGCFDEPMRTANHPDYAIRVSGEGRLANYSAIESP
jgi:hypothetical protein